MTTASCSQDSEVGPNDAFEFIGENKTVCGIASSVSNIKRIQGSAVYINLGPAYPNHVFTIVVWEESQDRLGIKTNEVSGKEVCVTGTIYSYRNIPQIEVNVKSQLWIK